VRLFARPVPQRFSMSSPGRCHLRSPDDETTCGSKWHAWKPRQMAQAVGLYETFRAKFEHPYTGVLWPRVEKQCTDCSFVRAVAVHRGSIRDVPLADGQDNPEPPRPLSGRARPPTVGPGKASLDSPVSMTISCAAMAGELIAFRGDCGVPRRSKNEIWIFYPIVCAMILAHARGPNPGVDRCLGN
jgi:hypothetical protein